MKSELAGTPDVIVVGGGTVGGWTAVFLAEAGLKVTLIDADALGRGSSSRAAGMVRGQGGTPAAVKLGMWTRDFYRGQRERYGADSGFTPAGYLLPAFTTDELTAAGARMRMQQSLGLDVEWLEPGDERWANPVLSAMALGGTYSATDGYLDPPRNVAAYTAALLQTGVQVLEHTACVGLRRDTTGAVVAVQTTHGDLPAGRVVLAGGAGLDALTRLVGVSVPVGGARHQVAVTAPHPALAPGLPMGFDVTAGLYWRPEDGGVLFGMSNPAEPPGEHTDIDWKYLKQMRDRLSELLPSSRGLPLHRVWAATIDYTPDHLPIVGAVHDADGPIPGLDLAAAAGHGMMWGPAVSRLAADVVLDRASDILHPADLSMQRFDADGASTLIPDPISLPFPARTGHPTVAEHASHRPARVHAVSPHEHQRGHSG